MAITSNKYLTFADCTYLVTSEGFGEGTTFNNSSSKKLITKSEIVDYLDIDETDAGFSALSSNSLVTRSRVVKAVSLPVSTFKQIGNLGSDVCSTAFNPQIPIYMLGAGQNFSNGKQCYADATCTTPFAPANNILWYMWAPDEGVRFNLDGTVKGLDACY